MKDHKLYPFFQYFPKASIIVAPWDTQESGFRPIQKFWYNFTPEELRQHNELGRAIYFTPCDLISPEHKLENHAGIRAWYCDIDVAERNEQVTLQEVEKRKSEALGRIFAFELEPSFVVETRNGFHVYWLAYIDEQSPQMPSKENFDYIESLIVSKLKGDVKANKLVQLMRLPGYDNCKKGQRFPCRIIPEFCDVTRAYMDQSWLDVFGEPKKTEVVKETTPKFQRLERAEKYILRLKSKHELENANDIFIVAQNMDQKRALELFSGHAAVMGEQYTFQEVAGGRKLNIIVNGQGCASFVDLDQNKIFCPSGTKGSPNIIEWLKWYNDYEGHELAKLLKEVLLNEKKNA